MSCTLHIMCLSVKQMWIEQGQGRNWNVSYKRPSIADLTKHKYLVSDMQCTMNKDLDNVSAHPTSAVDNLGFSRPSFIFSVSQFPKLVS